MIESLESDHCPYLMLLRECMVVAEISLEGPVSSVAVVLLGVLVRKIVVLIRILSPAEGICPAEVYPLHIVHCLVGIVE